MNLELQVVLFLNQCFEKGMKAENDEFFLMILDVEAVENMKPVI